MNRQLLQPENQAAFLDWLIQRLEQGRTDMPNLHGWPEERNIRFAMTAPPSPESYEARDAYARGVAAKNFRPLQYGSRDAYMPNSIGGPLGEIPGRKMTPEEVRSANVRNYRDSEYRAVSNARSTYEFGQKARQEEAKRQQETDARNAATAKARADAAEARRRADARTHEGWQGMMDEAPKPMSWEEYKAAQAGVRHSW